MAFRLAAFLPCMEDVCRRDACCHMRPLQAGGVQLPPHCVISVDNAASYLEQQRLSTQAAAVFVAGWPMREADAKRLMVGKVVTVASLDLVCTKVRGCAHAHVLVGGGCSTGGVMYIVLMRSVECVYQLVGGDPSLDAWMPDNFLHQPHPRYYLQLGHLVVKCVPPGPL